MLPGMDHLRDLILEQRNNRNAVFVFPSETAAWSWRREYLRISGCRAVRNSRFVSWDSFKEKITSHQRSDKPVNSIIRRFFASSIAERNKNGPPLFRYIIPPEYSSNSAAFQGLILKILPELRSLTAAAGTENWEAVADYRLLYAEYCSFLSSNMLFEPSWEDPELEAAAEDYFIIYPELIEDYDEWSSLLVAAGCGEARCSSFRSRPFFYYDNSVIECDDVLRQITELLSSGIPAGSIAVTSADVRTAYTLKRRRISQESPF